MKLQVAIVGTGNISHAHIRAYAGKALVILRALSPGSLTLRAQAKGLKGGIVTRSVR